MVRSICYLIAFVAALAAGAARAAESYETAPVRPEGGDYVPPPFQALAVAGNTVRCLGRSYDLQGVVPAPLVAERPLLARAILTLNGEPLAPPPPAWQRRTPAVAIAARAWTAGGLRFSLRQTVEYDGFVTCDLQLAPAAGPTTVRELTLRLEYRPDAAALYQVPAFSSTWAGTWPDRKEFAAPIVGVWGGDDRAGFASYVASFRDWRTAGPWVAVSREGDGPGVVTYRVVAEPMRLDAPVTYRFGFIATPVRAPEKRHWQLYSLPASADGTEALVDRILIWGGLSDRYATFRTNAPEGDADKAAQVRAIHEQGKAALAYTTYSHFEEGAVAALPVWSVADTKGKAMAASIGGGMADRVRAFCCPGSRDWVDWKTADLRAAIERYQVDGFYVDTSYVIMPCANALHGHGWADAAGERRADLPVWSMREVWRRAYELLCQTRGAAHVYAHHKGGCPPALAAFTTAFCDGEQYTGQSIKNLTLDAFRAQISGRNVGPLALFLGEYYRSALYGFQQKSAHHNPTESVMLPLLHDVLPTGYPGLHPVREIIALRDDLGIAAAEWTPYYAADNPWRAEGAAGVVVSSYRTARGDTLLVLGNPTYEPARVRLAGPAAARAGRTFVAIDVLARLGRATAATPGYRWEEARPEGLEVGARSFAVYAFVRRPDELPAFAKQRGFVAAEASRRRAPLPEGALLVDDLDDPDWLLANDDGATARTEREPVDTLAALRVTPKPRHNAAALMRQFAQPPDWSGGAALTLWIRPDQPLPAAALDLRLRNRDAYGPPLKRVSPDGADAVLPAGRWTQLRYELGDAPRDRVHILRVYHHRGNLGSGPFDLDEVVVHPGAAPAGAGPAAPNTMPAPTVPD